MESESALLLVWAVCVVGVSALFHEFGHAWTARALGWRVIGLRWHWYGVACVADPNGKPQRLWKVALGGLATTALLALVFLAGTRLPDPAPVLFGFGFTINAVLLLTNLAPIRVFDGGQLLAGLRAERLQQGAGLAMRNLHTQKQNVSTRIAAYGRQKNLRTRIARYGKPSSTSRCPDCGSPLIAAYQERSRLGLELILVCADDCGYVRRRMSRTPR